MRFETKFDRWLVVVLIFSAIFTCVVLPAVAPEPLWVALVPALWLVALVSTLPQYYEVREDGLFLRQGWRKNLLPYASLVQLQSVSDTRSAAVFSTDRILVVTQDGRRFLIAVAEEQRFLAEVAKRSPQLERRSFGLAVPLLPPSIV